MMGTVMLETDRFTRQDQLLAIHHGFNQLRTRLPPPPPDWRNRYERMVARHLHQQSRAPAPKSFISLPPPPPPPPPLVQTQPGRQERQERQERPGPSPKRRKTRATIRQQAPLQSLQARHRKPLTSYRRTPRTELMVDHSAQLDQRRQRRWRWQQQQRGVAGNPRQPGTAAVTRKPRGQMVDWLILVCSKAARRARVAAAGAGGSSGSNADTGKVFLGRSLQRMVRQGWRVLPADA